MEKSGGSPRDQPIQQDYGTPNGLARSVGFLGTGRAATDSVVCRAIVPSLNMCLVWTELDWTGLNEDSCGLYEQTEEFVECIERSGQSQDRSR